MRLGRIEKWVLVHCYLKTVKHELPRDWRRPRGYADYEEPESLNEYLYKSEILLNYFPCLEVSRKKSSSSERIEKFTTTREYKQALVTLCRVFEQLIGKRLVKWWHEDESPSWEGITLTEEGVEVVMGRKLSGKCPVK